jgi:soluble lytic murein transglycosylase-like protein
MKVAWLSLSALSLGIVLSANGAILVHLRNGSEIEAQQQVQNGDVVQLFVDRGTIELGLSEIASVEPLPDPVVTEKQNRTEQILSTAEALKRASDAQALPPTFVKTVANVESGLCPDARSSKGAMGLMQLMPATASDLGVKADVPAENALGGAKYLRQLLLRYHGDARLALAAYNAGPGAVDKYRGIPPYPETIAYVNKVLAQYAKLQRASTTKTDN